jgi:hypothetical protein
LSKWFVGFKKVSKPQRNQRLIPQEITMFATVSPASKANTAAAGVSASLIPTELGYASGLALLSRFSQLMAYDGLVADTRRMQSDSQYAFEQLALAHTSTFESLRHCAMQVFALFHE